MFNRLRFVINTPTETLISFRKSYLIPQYALFLFFFGLSLFLYYTINEHNYYLMALSVICSFFVGFMIIFDSVIILVSEYINTKKVIYNNTYNNNSFDNKNYI